MRSCGVGEADFVANEAPAGIVYWNMGSAATRHRLTGALLATVVVAMLAAVVLVGPTAAFHFLPPAVTGEEARLASLLELKPGVTVAEIGAGTGALSVALARRIQPGGILYSTELDPERRRQIVARAQRERVSNLVVVEAGEATTRLPDACCDAIFMRNVYHHIADAAPFDQSLRRAVRPDGLVVIIDFEPGEFWHLDRAPAAVEGTRSGHGVGALVVARELERAGFRAERIIDAWGGGMYAVLLRAP